jgi:hypothetical protein
LQPERFIAMTTKDPLSPFSPDWSLTAKAMLLIVAIAAMLLVIGCEKTIREAHTAPAVVDAR